MMKENDRMHQPSKLSAIDILGLSMFTVFFISLLFL
jgi:hypothetical protein